MADQSQGSGWWMASDGKWYAPEQQPGPATAAPPIPPGAAPATEPASDGQPALPAGVELASPWIRLGSYIVDTLILTFTLYIGWIIWALIIGKDGVTPAKKLLGLRVIRSETNQPAGLGWMFWMRGVVAGFVTAIAIVFTLGIILFMPFWDKRNQNLWDKISGCVVVHDPNDAWNTATV